MKADRVAQRDRSDLAHLRRRIRQEARAAVNASSVAATSIHVALATAYLKRLEGANGAEERT